MTLDIGPEISSRRAPTEEHSKDLKSAADKEIERARLVASPAWKIYEASFPSDERRSPDAQLKVLKNSEYFFKTYQEAERVTGFLAGWNLGDFCFLEHLAVDKTIRSKGIGSLIVKDFIKDKERVVLEVEPPGFSPEADARIRFYQRLGFHINDYDYLQPPYEKGKMPVALKILSYPNPLSVQEFERMREIIYAKVYGVVSNESLQHLSF